MAAMDGGPRDFLPPRGEGGGSKRPRGDEDNDGKNKRIKRGSGQRPQLSTLRPIRRVPIPSSSTSISFESLVPRLREHEEGERHERLRRRRLSLSETMQPPFELPPFAFLGEDQPLPPDEPWETTQATHRPEEPLSFTPPVFSFGLSRRTNNVIRETREDAYIGFLDRFERISPADDDSEDRWTLTMQCVPETWIDDAWTELRGTGLVPAMFRALAQPGKGSYGSWLRSLPFDDQAMLFCLWFWFVNRLLKPGAEAPVTILSLTLNVAQLRLLFGLPQPMDHDGEEPLLFTLDEDDWLDSFYNVRFSAGARLGLSAEAWTVALSPANDVDPVRVVIAPESFLRVADHQDVDRPMPQSVLRQLHFPRTEPVRPAFDPADDLLPDEDVVMGGFGSDSSGSETTEGPFDLLVSGAGRVFAQLRDVVRGWVEAARKGLEAWTDAAARAWGWGLAPSPAGAALPWPRSSALPEPWLAYTGANDGYLAGVAATPNPMILNGGTHQPFVGVMDVGQGNCNVIFDRQGVALAFYDFGYTVESSNNAPSVDPIPKLSDGPLIILSHWDKDHIYLGRQHPLSFKLNWLAPSQDMGTGEIRETVSRIMQEGGHLYLWEQNGGHMTFPWGFVVRGDDPKGDRNNTGLAVYACVRDGAGNVAAPTAGTACANVSAATAAANVTTHMRGTAREGNELEGDLEIALALVEMRAIALVLNVPPAAHDRVFGIAFGAAFCVATYPIAVTQAQVIECSGVVHAAFVAEGASNAKAIQVATTAGILALERTAAGATVPVVTIVAAAQQAVAVARTGASGARPAAATFDVALFGHVNGAHPHANFDQAVATRAAELAETAVIWDDENNAKGVRQRSKVPVPRRAKEMSDTPEGELAGVATFLALTDITGAGTRAKVVEAIVAECRESMTSKKSGVATSSRARVIIEQLAVAAPAPGPVLPGLIQTTAASTNPPYAADEMFILSTGDVLIQHIPTQRFVPPPLVIGMVAPHHGSIKADGSYLDSNAVPWAPNSLPAYVVGCSPLGENTDERIVGSAAVAALGVNRAALAVPRANARRAALAALEAVAAGDDLKTMVAYAAARHVLAAATLADARTLVAAAKGLKGSPPYDFNDVIAAVPLAVSPQTTALARAATAIVDAVLVPTAWDAAQMTRSVKAATQAGHSIERPKIVPKSNHFDGIEEAVDVVKDSPLSSAECLAALTEAHGGVAPDADDARGFAVGIVAAITAPAAKAEHDTHDWKNGLLSDAKYPPDERRTTVVAAAVATAANAAGVPDAQTKRFARLLVRAALAPDALVTAALGAMNVPNVSLGDGIIAYPAGLPWNKFYHPNKEAVVIYRAHGYEIEMETTNQPPKNPAVGWIVGPPGTPLAPGVVDAVAGHGQTTYATR
jgi:hypothetical protein